MLTRHRKRIIWLWSAVLIVIVLSATGLLRRDAYLLNQAKRLVSFRIQQFEWLSFAQNLDYKILFNTQTYTVMFRTDEGWETFKVHSYPPGVRCSADGFEIVMRKGSIVERRMGSRVFAGKSNALLNFIIGETGDKRTGIIFSGKGLWRPLK